MSGIKRNIVAEIMADGKSSMEEVKKALSPENMSAENGRAISAGGDPGKYTGKRAVNMK